MINTRFSVAIHTLTLVASQTDKGVTSDFIAKSVNTNPVVIRRIGSLLKKANLLKGGPGLAGYSLVKEPQKNTLLDISICNKRERVISPAAVFDPDGKRTGSYQKGKENVITNNAGESYISYADYAIAILDEIENLEHINERFTVVGEKE